MRKLLISIIISGSMFALSACAKIQNMTLQPQQATKPSSYQANWYKTLQSDGKSWQKSFIQHSLNPEQIHPFSVTRIQTRPFSSIVIHGNFQVQILGDQAKPHLDVIGNWQEVRSLNVSSEDGVLRISSNLTNPKAFLIRISAPVINQISLDGKAIVIAKNLMSTHLQLINQGSGNLLVDGKVNVADISSNGSGNIAVLDALGHNVTIANHGAGNIRLQGQYDVKSITDNGSGNVKIIGLKAKNLKINSGGSGDIILSGYGHLNKLTHTGSGNVYFYWLTGNHTLIHASGSGTIGLAGKTDDVTANIGGHVVFDGRFLRANDVSIKTTQTAKAKVIATKQLLASATDNSQILYYNQPKHLLKYHAKSGAVLDFSHKNIPNWAPPVKADTGYTG